MGWRHRTENMRRKIRRADEEERRRRKMRNGEGEKERLGRGTGGRTVHRGGS